MGRRGEVIARRWLIACMAALLVWLASGPGRAHGFHPGVLRLTEVTPGTFSMQWTEPVDTARPDLSVQLELPEGCSRRSAQLHCTPRGLHGSIAFRGLQRGRAPVVAIIDPLHAEPRQVLVRPELPELHLDGPSRSQAGFVAVGVQHILTGFDHVAFVVGLLLVVGTTRWRRLLLTITAFTAGHSVTLLLASRDLVHLSSAPVELTIAGSIVLLAREALHDEPTLTRRAPWLIAAVFGLVHGLGFAGALRSAGVDGSWGAVLWFNVGIELGQIGIIAVAVVASRLGRAHHTRLFPAACYTVGTLGAWWTCDRLAALVTGLS